MRVILAGTLICLLSGSAAGAAQEYRDQEYREREVGTASIRGRVIAAKGEGPIARAEVYLKSGNTRLVLTDADGRYAFTELPAGKYTLSAGRAGFASIGYGQRRPGDPLGSIELADGQSRQLPDLVLPHGGVIEVTVVDESGDPMDGAYVYPLRRRPASDEALDRIGPELSPLPGRRYFQTDERGRIRLYDLPPGPYFLLAVRFPSIVLDGPPQIGRAQDNRPNHAAVLYPGTMRVADAQAIHVEAGQEVNVQIPMTTTLPSPPSDADADDEELRRSIQPHAD